MSDRGKKKKVDIYEKYRRILNMRGLTNNEDRWNEETFGAAFPDHLRACLEKEVLLNLWMLMQK